MPQVDQADSICPLYHRAIELIGRRWTGAILQVMRGGVVRFSDLAAAIPGLSDRMLSERLKELEAQLERRPGDVFGGLFGSGRSARRPQPQRDERGPWERQDRYGGGGFLAGAAQTALGVTGGLLLGSAIGSLLGAGAANAAEPPPEPEPDQGADTGDAGNEGGGDFGDGGGFDFGGVF